MIVRFALLSAAGRSHQGDRPLRSRYADATFQALFSGLCLWFWLVEEPRNACTAGAAIVNGMVFWGSGDGRNNLGAAKMLFAFGL